MTHSTVKSDKQEDHVFKQRDLMKIRIHLYVLFAHCKRMHKTFE